MNSAFILLPLVLDLLICSVDAGKEKNYCNVCRAVVGEANWKISQSDPKRTVQVGSFRVDPHGNQNIKEKDYARSESHVEELFESICEELRDYAELTQEDGSTTVVRTSGRNGRRLETKDYVVNMAVGDKLRYQCHDFLEDHEEEVMSLLQRDNIENYEQVICGEQTSVCSEKDLSVPLIDLPEAEEEVLKQEDPEEDKEEDSEDEDEKTDDKEEEVDEGEDSATPDEKDEL